MTAPVGKTVFVLPGFTGPTGTFKVVDIKGTFTGPTGTFPIWNQATGPSGGQGLFEKVIAGTGPRGVIKTVIIPGYGASPPLSWKWNGAGGANFTTVGAGYMAPNNASIPLATAWKFSTTNSNGDSMTATFASILAGAGSPHKARIDFVNQSETGSISIDLDSDGGVAGGGQIFNTTHISASGSFNFNDVLLGTLTML